MTAGALALAEKELLAGGTVTWRVGFGCRRAHRALIPGHSLQFGWRQTERGHARSRNAVADQASQLVERPRAYPAVVRQVWPAFSAVPIAVAYRAVFREHESA